jgi:hypothetical protein
VESNPGLQWIAICLVGLVVFGIAVVGARYLRLPSRRVRSALARVPRKRLGETQDGEWAHVVGVVSAGKTVTSPLSGCAAVGYCFEIEEVGGDAMLADRQACAPFTLVADGVEALVEGPFVFDVAKERLADDVTGGVHAVLSEEGHVASPHFHGYLFRAREGLVTGGLQVAVVGRVSIEVDRRGERESPRGQPLRRIIRGTEERPVAFAVILS